MQISKILAGAACLFSAVVAKDFPKEGEHKDYKEVGNQPHHPKGYHPEHYQKLEEEYVCDKLTHFAENSDFIYELVKVLECGDDSDHCWEPVRKAIYELEFELDLFDTDIDNSDLSKCWGCGEETGIACCYRRYAEALIRALNIIADRIPYLDGDTAKYIITAINSLRAADYTFVYELVRRMHCEEYQMEIMEKQGPVDGSGPRSIREAFNRFLFTPLITAEDFKTYPQQEPQYDSGVQVVEEVVCSPEDKGCHHKKPHHPQHYPEPHHPHHHPQQPQHHHEPHREPHQIPHHHEPVQDQTYAQA